MLRGIKAERIREWLVKHLGDCSGLTRFKTRTAYDQALTKIIRKLQRSMGPRNKLAFGHAAKLVNLCVKAAISSREPLTWRQARSIRRWAHVPVDGIILTQVRIDFPECAAVIGIRRGAAIKDLSAQQHSAMQALLRQKAQQAKCDPLDYDLLWALGRGERLAKL
jgi:hypothetical protein